MSLYSNFETEFTRQYSANVIMRNQQQKARTRGTCYEESITGEMAFIETILPLTSVTNNQGRLATTILQDTTFERRSLAINDAYTAQGVDSFDKVRILIDADSQLAENQVRTINRQFDDYVIAAFNATAFAGKTGTTPIALPGAQIVAVNSWKFGTGSGNVGLTVSKFLEAKYLLDSAEAPEEDRYAMVSPHGLSDMLATTEATSAEYSEVKALMKGEINEFAGFNIIRSARLTTDGNGYRLLPFWQKNAMGIGIAKDITAEVTMRPDLRNSWQILTKLQMGVTRMQENGVVIARCFES